MDEKGLCNLIYELGALKKLPHSGPKLHGVRHPDSIAEHIYRTAIIGYILAIKEKVPPERVVLMCLVHDNAESRISDLHKVARRYIDPRKAEKKAFKEQLKNCPKTVKETFEKLFEEFEDQKSRISIIARDADLLETIFQSKEYVDIGYKACQDIVDNAGKYLLTSSAKKLAKTAQKIKFTDWFSGLKKLPKDFKKKP
jgi:putative hydrolase of HD superfamily